MKINSNDNISITKKKIINRDKYMDQILTEFDNVFEGNMGLTIITGNAGVSKTYLVENTDGFFVSNKCTYIKVITDKSLSLCLFKNRH